MQEGEKRRERARVSYRDSFLLLLLYKTAEGRKEKLPFSISFNVSEYNVLIRKKLKKMNSELTQNSSTYHAVVRTDCSNSPMTLVPKC